MQSCICIDRAYCYRRAFSSEHGVSWYRKNASRACLLVREHVFYNVGICWPGVHTLCRNARKPLPGYFATYHVFSFFLSLFSYHSTIDLICVCPKPLDFELSFYCCMYISTYLHSDMHALSCSTAPFIFSFRRTLRDICAIYLPTQSVLAIA